MCGRFALTKKDLEKILTQRMDFDYKDNWNITPSQDIVIFDSHKGVGVAVAASWGFVPTWMKKTPKTRPINARSETASSNGYFRSALKGGRCLIPASGYYEWQNINNTKQPWYIYNDDTSPLVFAGLTANSEFGHTCAILTRSASKPIANIHTRMPVMILQTQMQKDWLAGQVALEELVQEEQYSGLEFHRVSTQVNSPRHNFPDCIQKIPDTQSESALF